MKGGKMRTDLRLDYSHLESIRSRIQAYYDALDEIQAALEGLKTFLEEQESETINKLKEKISDAKINMTDKKETLNQLGSVVEDYISDMRALVKAAAEGVQTRVDTWDISLNWDRLKDQ